MSDRIDAVVLADQLAGGAAISDRAPGQAECHELTVVNMTPPVRALDDLYVYSGLFDHTR
jgi:hypothetical protein